MLAASSLPRKNVRNHNLTEEEIVVEFDLDHSDRCREGGCVIERAA